jgi:hypothetical protein
LPACREITANLPEIGRSAVKIVSKTSANSVVCEMTSRKFPARRNRESVRPQQGINSRPTGNSFRRAVRNGAIARKPAQRKNRSNLWTVSDFQIIFINMEDIQERLPARDPENLPAADYTVGYCRPPVATRFRPVRSGNPRGRPEGSRNLASIVAAAR